MRKDIIDKKYLVEDWIKQNRPKQWMARELRCRIDTLNSYLRKWGIEYSGNMGEKGYKISKNKKHVKDYLKNNFSIATSKLRKKLIEYNVKEKKCEMCGLNEWLGKEITLELHHINGDRYDNRLENLQILCPNCHSLTPNHSMKEIYREAPMAKWETHNA